MHTRDRVRSGLRRPPRGGAHRAGGTPVVVCPAQAPRLRDAVCGGLDQRARRCVELHRADVACAEDRRPAGGGRGAARRQHPGDRVRPARRRRGGPVEPPQAHGRSRSRARRRARAGGRRGDRRLSPSVGARPGRVHPRGGHELLRPRVRGDDPGSRRAPERPARERARRDGRAGAVDRRLGRRGRSARVPAARDVLRGRRGDVLRLCCGSSSCASPPAEGLRRTARRRGCARGSTRYGRGRRSRRRSSRSGPR